MEQKIIIQASSGLSKEEIDQMQRDADVHAQEDAQRREEVETRNMADSLAYQGERTLSEHGDKVPAELKSEVEGKIAAVRSALQSGGLEQIQSAAEALSEALQRLGAAVYQQQQPEADGADGAGPEPASESSSPEEGAVEGEYREV